MKMIPAGRFLVPPPAGGPRPQTTPGSPHFHSGGGHLRPRSLHRKVLGRVHGSDCVLQFPWKSCKTSPVPRIDAPRPKPSVVLALRTGNIGPASVRRLLMISGRGHFPDGSYASHEQPITKHGACGPTNCRPVLPESTIRPVNGYGGVCGSRLRAVFEPLQPWPIASPVGGARSRGHETPLALPFALVGPSRRGGSRPGS
jgi:hypothetical protein